MRAAAAGQHAAMEPLLTSAVNVFARDALYGRSATCCALFCWFPVPQGVATHDRQAICGSSRVVTEAHLSLPRAWRSPGLHALKQVSDARFRLYGIAVAVAQNGRKHQSQHALSA